MILLHSNYSTLHGGSQISHRRGVRSNSWGLSEPPAPPSCVAVVHPPPRSRDIMLQTAENASQAVWGFRSKSKAQKGEAVSIKAVSETYRRVFADIYMQLYNWGSTQTKSPQAPRIAMHPPAFSRASQEAWGCQNLVSTVHFLNQVSRLTLTMLSGACG